MAQEGKTAAEILAFLAKASRRPFNRVLAVALQKAGLQTSITVDSQGGWSVGNRSYAAKYAAAYSPKADKVALFTPRDAERKSGGASAGTGGGVSVIACMSRRRIFLVGNVPPWHSQGDG
ncbi:MAG: hypothetical protein BWY76_02069 [bacterium ADurb.Bin429]|nr:MAG: hypothetical protein BWY76_02069 [bacterium ADurb.Bin429]